MSDVTIAQFAEVLKVPVDKLLAQLEEAEALGLFENPPLGSNQVGGEDLSETARLRANQETEPTRVVVGEASRSTPKGSCPARRSSWTRASPRCPALPVTRTLLHRCKRVASMVIS